MNINYPDSFIKKILEESNTIAIVGASSKEERDSYKVMKYLLQKGYKVFPVNPYESGKNILGQKCYEDLESIKQSIDIVDVFRANAAVLGIAKQAITISAEVLWTQEDIIHH